MATDTSSTDGDQMKEGSRGPSGSDAPVRTFLIADVRGYTPFTQEQGDEAAGELAHRFATLAREAVLSCGGDLIEVRGDEALCVFASARQALRAAVELQTRFRGRADGGDGAAFPLPIGIGLDAGEAVPVDGGYRGGALNTAARLCSIAGPGQILATDTVVSLARQLEGIRFVDRRPVRLKGLEKPVRVIEVVPEAGLPPLPEIQARRPRVTRRRTAVAVIAGVGIIAAAVALLVSRTLGRDFLSHVDANSIGVIDAKVAGITGQVELGSSPSSIAAGGGYVWVASEADGTVSRIDPGTHAVRTLSLGKHAGGLAHGAGSLWVAEPDDRAVAQIDPNTLRIVQTIPVGNGPAGVAVGPGGVWVANTFDGTVSRISLSHGAVTKTIPVGVRPAGIAVGARAVWVTDELNGTVLRIDPRSRRVVHATSVGNGPEGVAVGKGQVWVANREDGTISRIDVATNSVSATIPVGASPTAVAAGPGAVWVANEGAGTLARIDTETGRPDKRLSLESSPHALVLSGKSLWVTTLPALPSHRGGVLRVESDPSECRCTDPAYFSQIVNLTDQNVITLAYDGLVAYRRVGGVAGGALVGDLAIDVPAPTDSGRTYTFQLRPELRYSNGARVRASDFRYSLERMLTVNREYGLHFYKGIVGAAECSARPPECDLSRGIEVDDGAGRITIHLTEADPDFLGKLTFPLASVVPARTPLRAARGRAIPGTGPYRVASFAPKQEVRLVRNPYFSVWSQDARPDGYPDAIDFRLSEYVAGSVTAVEKGKADWVDIGTSALTAERVQGLLTRHAGRLHSDPLPFSFWMFVNTKVPPFDDVRARQALNYAVDRDAVRKLSGAAALGVRISCQILTPGFPGYRPYCPYTLNPNRAGTWIAPDLAKARALVAASRTRGMRVEVVTFETAQPFPLKNARYYVSLLEKLGYRSSLRVLRRGYYEYAADSRNEAQLGQWGWVAETLAPSNFLRLFSCGAFLRGTSASENPSEFCDRSIDAKMRRAAALQASDPARANELWADVDHALVDRAAAVFSSTGGTLVFVSKRVGNYQSHPLWGTLLDQLWVK